MSELADRFTNNTFRRQRGVLLPGTTEEKEAVYWKTLTIPPIPSSKPTFCVAWGWEKNSAAFPSPGTQNKVEHKILLLTHTPLNCCQHLVRLRTTYFMPWLI